MTPQEDARLDLVSMLGFVLRVARNSRELTPKLADELSEYFVKKLDAYLDAHRAPPAGPYRTPGDGS